MDSTVEGPTAMATDEKNAIEDRTATRFTVNGSCKTEKFLDEVRATPVRRGTPETQRYYAEQEQFWKERDDSLSSILSDAAELPSDGTTSYAERVAGDTDDRKSRVSIKAGGDVQARRTSGARKTHHDALGVRQPTYEERYQQRPDGGMSVPIGDQESLVALEARRRQEVRQRRRRRLCALREAEKLLSAVVDTVEGDGTMVGDASALSFREGVRIAIALGQVVLRNFHVIQRDTAQLSGKTYSTLVPTGTGLVCLRTTSLLRKSCSTFRVPDGYCAEKKLDRTGGRRNRKPR